MPGISNPEIEISVYNSSPVPLLPIIKVVGLCKVLFADAISRGRISSDGRDLKGYKFVACNIVYLSDNDIHNMNNEFLGHDYPTDAITFTIEDTGTELEGEVYIGAETAKRQAKEYGVTQTKEIMRLAVHGCLHMLGMEDDTPDQKKKMTQEEDRYLNMYNS